MRRLLIITFIFLVAVSLAVLGYAYLRRAPAEKDKSAAEDAPAGAENQKVLASFVISAVPSFNGERVWYLTTTGKIYSVNLETEAREEFAMPIPLTNLTGALWQEKGSDLVIEQNVGGHLRYIYVDTKNRRIIQYPDNIRTPVVLAGDKRIAYDWVSDKHELKVSDIDSTNFSAIGELFRPDYVLESSTRKQEIVMFGLASTSPLVHVDLEKKEFKNLAGDGEYLSAKFSPDGAKLLVEENKQGQKILWVYDFAAGQRIDLPVADAKFTLWTRDSGGVMFGNGSAVKEASLRSSDIKEWAIFPEKQVKSAFLHPFQDILFYIDEGATLHAADLKLLPL